jgi:hypothetical protein
MLAKDPQHRPTLPQIRSVVEGARSPGPARAEAVASRPASRKTVAIAASALLAGIVLGAVLRGSRPGGARSTVIAAPPPSTATDARANVEVEVAPPASIDAGAAPVAKVDAGVAMPRVAIGSRQRRPIAAAAPIDAGAISLDAAPVPEPVPVDAAEATPTPARPRPPTKGYLKIVPPPSAVVLVDGTAPIGPLSRLPLAPGKHRIQFVAGANKDSFIVAIEAGETMTLDKRGLYQAGPGSDDRNRTVNPFARKQAPR